MNHTVTELVHGTCIALGDWAALLIGPPGCGKSDLALRCLALGRSELCPTPFQLVSDDQTLVSWTGDRLVASAPDTIRDRIEVRGVGLIDVPAQKKATLLIWVDLVDGPVERLPDLIAQNARILDRPVHRMALRPFECSAPAKLAAAFRILAGGEQASNNR